MAGKNLEIRHMGSSWPVGSVLSVDQFGDPTRHLELGAVVWTDRPVNVEAPIADIELLGDDELAAENARLKDLLGTVPQQIAKLTQERDAAFEKANKAEAEATETKALLEVASAEAADLKAQVDELKRTIVTKI